MGALEGFFAALGAKAWLLLAALVGSMTGAYFIRPKSFWEWIVTIGGGFFASIYVAPAVISYWLPGVPGSDGRVGAIYYTFALMAMVAVPPLMRRLEKLIVTWGAKA